MIKLPWWLSVEEIAEIAKEEGIDISGVTLSGIETPVGSDPLTRADIVELLRTLVGIPEDQGSR